MLGRPRKSVSFRNPQAHGSLISSQNPDGLLGVSAAAAEQSIANLSQLEVKGPLSSDQAAAVKLELQRLVAEGAGSIPAIRRFLQQNRDSSLDELKGGSSVGYPTLRAGIFDALRQIGGTAGESLLADTLHSTGDPGEVAVVARYLDELAPGQHREEVVNAARETLMQLTQEKSKADVGPLFQILQNYGDGNVVSDLTKALPEWYYSSVIALAGLSGGQGIPALIEQAQNPDDRRKSFALQMLAQVSAQNPEAASALIEQAKSGEMSDRAWSRIAATLMGEQYQFGGQLMQDRVPGLQELQQRTRRTSETGNETFWSVTALPDEALSNQRTALIDQLLSVTLNTAAIKELENARTALRARVK